MTVTGLHLHPPFGNHFRRFFWGRTELKVRSRLPRLCPEFPKTIAAKDKTGLAPLLNLDTNVLLYKTKSPC